MKKQRATNPPPTEADLKRLQLELEVHQVELEMQNTSLLATQTELHDALSRYTDFYEFAPVGYLSLNPDGEIRQLNLATATLLGTDRSHLVNRRLQLFVSVADIVAFADFLRRVFEGHSQTCEVTLAPQAAAPPLIVHFEAISVPSGQECRMVMTNITERRRADELLRVEAERKHVEEALRAEFVREKVAEALRVEAERRHILFEQLPDGILVIDPQTARFVEFNTAAHQQ